MKITRIVKIIGAKLPGHDRYHPIHVENLIEVEVDNETPELLTDELYLACLAEDMRALLIKQNELDYAAQYKDITGKEPTK